MATFGLSTLVRKPCVKAAARLLGLSATRPLGCSAARLAITAESPSRRVAEPPACRAAELPLIDCTPSQIRYAAPTVFTTLYAVAEVARIAEMPRADAVAWIRQPAPMPRIVSIVRRR